MNNILCVYAGKAAEQGVSTDILANGECDLKISAPDLVAIVANLIENAIHGAVDSGHPNPYIKVRIYPRVDKLSIRCENCCTDALCFDYEFPSTLKGVGISSIMTSAARYGGQCSFTARDGVFTAVVLLDI